MYEIHTNWSIISISNLREIIPNIFIMKTHKINCKQIVDCLFIFHDKCICEVVSNQDFILFLRKNPSKQAFYAFLSNVYILSNANSTTCLFHRVFHIEMSKFKMPYLGNYSPIVFRKLIWSDHCQICLVSKTKFKKWTPCYQIFLSIHISCKDEFLSRKIHNW